MSEMLGNRYFIARKFSKAIPYLEAALTETPQSAKIKRKLIICYIQTGHFDDAFRLLYEVINSDPKVILETDLYYDDCPCVELIPQWQAKEPEAANKMELYEVLGMLYLYCDIDKAIEYFNKAKFGSSHSAKLISLVKKLEQLRPLHH